MKFRDMGGEGEGAHRPKMRGESEAATPINPAPIAIMNALVRTAPLRPQRSMIMFAPRLPRRPPTV